MADLNKLLEGDIPDIPTDRLIEGMRKLIENPRLLEKLFNDRVKSTNRRRHHSTLSNSSYYTEDFALAFKKVLDEMVETGEPREYKYVDFPKYSRNTLYLLVQQSKLFLIDNIDPEEYYLKLMRRIRLDREKTGIRLTLRPQGITDIPMPSKIAESTSDWEFKINKFLETAQPGESLHLKKLSLTKEQVDMQKESFEPLQDVVALITATEIKIAKLKV